MPSSPSSRPSGLSLPAAFLTASSLTLAALAAPTASAGADAGRAPPRSRPNIVFILADDHGLDALSCYGSTLIKTPNIDRIAQGGIRFTHAYATDSMCSPSRASILTGKYNCECGVERLEGHFDGTQQTFPKLLQAAGYQTALIGKWHLYTEPTGFDYYNCITPGWGGLYDNPKFKTKGQPWINGNTGGVVHPGYLTDIITDMSIAWMEQRDPTRPFCLLITHKAPHGPDQAAPRDQYLFANRTFGEPATLLDDYVGRAPYQVRDALPWSRLIQDPETLYQPVKARFTGDVAHDTRLMYQAYVRNYLRVVTGLDENVGRVLDYLKISGLLKNTIVVYASDNGFFLGEHGFYNKMWMYEEGFHVPLLIMTPGGKEGVTSDQLVCLTDLAPTLLQLAGVDVPRDIQGESLIPLMQGGKTRWRDALFYHYYGYILAPSVNWIGSPEAEIIGVRTKRAKLIFYPRLKDKPFWEYFDLGKDPTEMVNLFSDASRQSEIIELQHQLSALARKYNDQGALSQLEAVGVH